SSLCRVPFIAVLLSWVWENSHSRRSSFRGLRQADYAEDAVFFGLREVLRGPDAIRIVLKELIRRIRATRRFRRAKGAGDRILGFVISANSPRHGFIAKYKIDSR